MENKTAEEMITRGTGNFINCTDYDDAISVIKNLQQQLAEKDKEIDMLKKSLEGLLDGVDTFCKTIPAQMTSEAIYLWEKRTEAHESLNK